jgi:AbrB family looped-hinge helix DNA binding protein
MGAEGIARVRQKGQVTLPSAVREAAHIKEGTVVEVSVTAEGAVLLRPKLLVDAADAWYWTPEWQAGEREVDEDIAAGRVETFDNADDFIADLDREAGERGLR